MDAYAVSAARTTTPHGEEFLVVSIPPEQYSNEKVQARWFAAFRHLSMPFVLASATSKEEWSLRSDRTDLAEYLASLPFGSVERMGWHRMYVECEQVPWEV
jgi:hypothetical protein